MDMDQVWGMLAFVLVALVIVGVFVYASIYNRRRREAAEQVARELGFQFSPGGDQETFQELHDQRFDLFQRGRPHQFSNVLRRQGQDGEMLLFDYTYSTRSGKHHHTHYTTAVMLRLSRLNLPDFMLRPEHALDRLAAKFGKVDINFDHRPEFSKHFHLSGDDEAAIRALFTDRLMDALERRPAQELMPLRTIEAHGNTLLVYHSDKLLGPEQWPELVNQANGLVAAFSKEV
jgi:hypothetical protein